MRPRLLAVALAVLVSILLQGTPPSSAVDVRSLPKIYQEWLVEVGVLISAEEKATFLALEKDYQRDAFIRGFWAARDPYPETARNEFKQEWDARVEAARERWHNLTEDRARILLLYGEPADVLQTNCGQDTWPLELWSYPRTPPLPPNFYFLFTQQGGSGAYHLWRPRSGYGEILPLGDQAPGDLNKLLAQLRFVCGDVVLEKLQPALLLLESAERGGLLDSLEARPKVRDDEWLRTFGAHSTDIAKDVAPLAADFAATYPRRERGRTILEGLLTVRTDQAQAADLAGHRAYNFLLTGEVLRESELFESFRYRFDPPALGDEKTLPLPFERPLRAGSYTLVLKLEDLNSGRVFRREVPIEVPALDPSLEPGAAAGAASAASAPGDPQVAGALAEAYETISPGAGEGDKSGPGVRLVAPPGDTLTGSVRIDAVTAGEGIRKVTFLLDGKPLLTKGKPPYSVELNLGPLPRTRRVRAAAYDEAGQEVASDELTLNAGAQPFTVRLVEPRPGRAAGGAAGHLRARAELHLPDGARLDRLEIFVDDTRVATLYQPPFVQPLVLPPGSAPSYVRAVAYLADGTTTENLVLLNAPDTAEEIDVQLVEVYAAVTGGDGRPLTDLKREEVTVTEDGVPQQVVRFERVAAIPIHAVLILDTSASMTEVLPQVQKTGLQFLEKTLGPADRAAIVTFSDSPQIAVKFTNDIHLLASALAGLRAERGTALFDCIVYALQYLKGVQGQSALLLVSDGGDRSSKFTFEQALEFARRTGVTIYTLGFGVKRLDLEGRGRLSKLAAETGGRSYFGATAEDIAGAYDEIQQDLRTRWLIAYQSTNATGATDFRNVEVKVTRPGVEVKALRGYYPK